MKSLLSLSSKLMLLIILLAFSSAESQNINDALRLGLPGLGSNARALGMGNSYIGLSDDASAAFFNPAGFGLLKRMEFSGGLQYTNFDNNTSFLNQATDYSNSSTTLDRISFAFPFPTMRGSLVFGLSYHTTKDFTGTVKFDGFNNTNTSMIQNLLDTDIPFDLYLTDDNNNTIINGHLNQSGTILNSGAIHNWTFSGAVEVSKNVFIGANLNIINGSFDMNNDYYEDDTHNIYQDTTAPGYPDTYDFQSFYFNRILNWDLSGWNVKAGLLYQLNKYARIGATVQFPKTFTVKEKFDVDGSSTFGTGVTYYLDRSKYSDQVQYDIITPFSLGLGFSANYRGFIFSLQGELTDYSQLKFDSPGNGLSVQYIADQNKNIKDQLGSVINYNLGVEYTIAPLGMRLRGGYFVQPSPYKGDPSEYNHQYVTGGIGFLANETIGIDLAIAHGWWKNYGDNYGTDVSRTYQDISVNKLILTATYRF
jgi:long-subunit fatty acid transport protein